MLDGNFILSLYWRVSSYLLLVIFYFFFIRSAAYAAKIISLGISNNSTDLTFAFFAGVVMVICGLLWPLIVSALILIVIYEISFPLRRRIMEAG